MLEDEFRVTRFRVVVWLLRTDEELPLLVRERDPELLLRPEIVVDVLFLLLYIGDVLPVRERSLDRVVVLLLVVLRLLDKLLFLLFAAVLLLVVDRRNLESYLCGLYPRERLRRSIVLEVVKGICL